MQVPISASDEGNCTVLGNLGSKHSKLKQVKTKNQHLHPQLVLTPTSETISKFLSKDTGLFQMSEKICAPCKFYCYFVFFCC